MAAREIGDFALKPVIFWQVSVELVYNILGRKQERIMTIATSARIVLAITLALAMLGGSALADKATAMKRQKAAQTDKYQEILVMQWPAADKWKSAMVHTSGATTMEFFYPEDGNGHDRV